MKQTDNKIWPLDVCRGVAAFYVVLHHSREMLPAAIRPLLLFGQEAVILFFLLSGFVIHYTYYNKEWFDRSDFLWKRFIRIYPILIVVMLFSWIADVATGAHDPDINMRTFVYNLLGMQDSQLQKPGIGYATFGGNDPLWSLGYEIWYYAFYAIAGAKNFERNMLLVTVIAVVSCALFALYPNKIWLTLFYLPIWWLGVAIAQMQVTKSNKGFLQGILSASIALLAYGVFQFRAITVNHTTIGLHPLVEIRHFATAIAMALVWVLMMKRLRMQHLEFLRPLSVLSAVSYGVYIVHLPLLRAVKAYLPSNIFTWLLFVLLTVLVGWLLEIRFQKRWMLPLLRRQSKRRMAIGPKTISE
ncbi:acyltransferase [Chitinophaga agrisoli]|uniref:Acyltransferase n=1 Tax=Chitinophaga agrisoli TaxID=2607653 RepID=A0A5B2VZT7_9BACT|nr:acyltransferase [Chitinophaga agrisoli]KAA2243657.1 acyltransferase [Chitinophaga agrisoli]